MNSNTAIDLLGGTTAAAKFFEVRPPTVSEWRKTGFPRAREMYLRAVRMDIYLASGGKFDAKFDAKSRTKD